MVFLVLISSLIMFLFMIISSLEANMMVPAVYVFGDSLVDVGNNDYLKISLAKADFPHNGIDFPTKKATGRFSNGKNAADFLAEKLGLSASPPYLSLSSRNNNTNVFLTGVSFASGGAGIFNGTDVLYKQSISLTMQVGYFSKVCGDLSGKLSSNDLQNHLSKSIIAIVIGSNDIFGYHSPKSNVRNTTSPQQYVDQMVADLKEHLKRIYDIGARKFLITGLGPVGCCPAERKQNKTEGCNEEQNNMAYNYNTALISMLQDIKQELKDIYYTYFDTYSVLLSFIQTPALYGFTEVKSACCGLGNLRADIPCIPIAQYCSTRKSHVFWDLYHPTETSASIFVDHIYNGSQQYTFPINVRQLVEV